LPLGIAPRRVADHLLDTQGTAYCLVSAETCSLQSPAKDHSPVFVEKRHLKTTDFKSGDIVTLDGKAFALIVRPTSFELEFFNGEHGSVPVSRLSLAPESRAEEFRERRRAYFQKKVDELIAQRDALN
jgi:hypothetical protein